MTAAGPARPVPRLPRRAVRVLIGLAVLVVLIILFLVFDGVYTDWLWFRSVGYTSVFTTRVTAQIVLFVVIGLISAIAVGANLVVAYRLRPAAVPHSAEQVALGRYRLLLDPVRWFVLALVCLLVFVTTGSAAGGRWQTWMLWRNQVSFGTKDQQFHRDISYFAFTYPFQRWLLGVAFTITVLSLIAALVAHYLLGALRINTPGQKVTAAARAHLSLLLGLFVALKAVAYYLDRYGLAFSSRGVVTGPSYTDVNAVLPAKTILLVIAAICSLLFFANVARRNWTLPAIGFGLMVLSAIVIGGLYPLIIQQFIVRPNEAAKERIYIQRNINATRKAYQLGSVNEAAYPGSALVTASDVAAATGVVPDLRLLDPNVLQPTYQQLQQIRAYYGFATLAIDRYSLGGNTQPYVVAVREVDPTGLQPDQQNWINEHLVYTHGFGFVAAPADTITATGGPQFTESNIPPTGPLAISQPRVYYGLVAPQYSIVDTTQQELDFSTSTGADLYDTYGGKGGVGIGGFFDRLLYAVRFRDRNLLLSSALTPRSQILYIRNPLQRVHEVAPYLALDSDPYPAVVDGHIYWIIDGYTTSDGYPYAERVNLNSVASGALNTGSEINYIRNSVKATVDAYTGAVKLYTWDPGDPVLKTWERVFPHTVLPESAIPPDLLVHFRYPEGLFDVQRTLFASYHVGNPKDFYTKQDFWAVPEDPQNPGNMEPPTYIYAQLPGEPAAEFNIVSPLVFRGRANLAAYMYVSSDGSDYGTIRSLELPQSTQVNGPGQAEAAFEAYPPFSTEKSLLDQGGSQVILGQLLTYPIAGGLLYVDPVYVQSTGVSSYPLLQKVLVGYGSRVGFGDSVSAALDSLFGTGAGIGAAGSPGALTGGRVSTEILALLDQARTDYQQAEAALQQSPPNFAAYGTAESQLGAVLNEIASLTKAAKAR